MVLKTMTSDGAQQGWGTVIDEASEPDTAVIIESQGKPKVAVISYAEFLEFRNFKEQQRRASLLRKLDALESRYGNRNTDLTSEQAAELADRFTRESIDELIAEGKIAFLESPASNSVEDNIALR